MRKTLVWSAVAAVGLSLGLTAAPASAAVAMQDLSPEVQQVVDNLPAMRERAEAVRAELGLADSPVRDALLAAIDPTQYECSSATPPVVAAIMPDVAAWSFEQRLAVLHVLLFDMAMLDAVYFPQSGPFSYGVRGEFTHTVNKTFQNLKGFWDIPSSDVELVPAHGRIMLDAERDYRVFTVLYGADPAASRVSADLVARELNSAALGYGDLPLFTFNAYAAPGGEDVPAYGASHRRIAFGDGVLEGFAKIGLGDVAPQAILAHEFGHQIQYSDGLMRTDLPAPESARWAELMADAFSAYFLTHARGEAMNWKRVQAFGQMFYQLGDCGFTSAGHHGTPNQRMGSALWAYGVADAARPQGFVLPARSFYDLFAARYPQLIAPDATT
ncbi:hypothetical protein EV137_4151 [Kribbella pratensis]|uniref:DUF2268 domain-containing protein n=1 Tax=Kribbella pratensis TaxID=2512112 RepID=A0ABY2FG36_9ACTN|nr:hypothetical protein [Kribbella pratensis]TDW90335.1 hypothetical protein EV137_4151 [Kribbella pratensis]